MMSLTLRSSLRQGAIPALFLLILLASGPARALQVDWSGTLVDVGSDTGGGLFAGSGVGDAFSGFFVYGASCATGCTTESFPNETDYHFSLGSLFQAFVSDATRSTTFLGASVFIEDDLVLDAADAALVSGLLGTTVTAGTTADAFTLSAQTPDAAFDDATDRLLQGSLIEVVLASFDTSLFSDTSFQSMPPAIGSVDFAFFFIEQADAGVTLYDAVGALDPVVPEPGASLLIAPLLALGLAARARR